MPEHVLVAAFVSAAAGFAALSAFALQMARRHRERFERTVDRSLRGAFLFVDPGSLHRMSMLLAIVITLVAWVLSANPIVAIVAALAAGALPGLAVARIRRRHVDAFRQQIPDLLMLIAGALRAGNGLAQALAGAAAEIAPNSAERAGRSLRKARETFSVAPKLTHMETIQGGDQGAGKEPRAGRKSPRATRAVSAANPRMPQESRRRASFRRSSACARRTAAATPVASGPAQ